MKTNKQRWHNSIFLIYSLALSCCTGASIWHNTHPVEIQPHDLADMCHAGPADKCHARPAGICHARPAGMCYARV